jgi:ElaB/YqjD/DUF883 family membrane-anchored ribosome-binding protein
MASEPIPEPLTNQDLDEKREPKFRAPRTGVSDKGESLNAVSAPVDPARELMPVSINPQLKRAAESVGTSLGRLVNQARGISAPSNEIGPSWTETAHAKANQARQKASRALSEVQEGAAKTYQQTQERVRETIEEAKQKTSATLRQSKANARRISYEYPLQVIAGAAAAGFLAGVLLRVWRSSRYE